ncbi:MAG: KamA family radical SAM protein [Planctomycetaceae bacterium]
MPESVQESAGHWQRDLASAIRSVDTLLERLGLSAEQFQGFATEATLRRFPLLVPESFVNRMEHGDPADPLLRQVLPFGDEDRDVAGFVSDAVGDLQARRGPGLIQKYAGRVLLITTGACAVHCRYCFRRDYPYVDEPRRLEEWSAPLAMIAEDTSIHEVILSGGDPLMLNDGRLETLCRQLDEIAHLGEAGFIRGCSAVASHGGSDSTAAESSGQPVFVIHSNHANELTGDCADAVKRLGRAGFPVLNQAVLLKGINDTVEAQEQLSRRLMQLGVIPYYLHQLDRVSGSSHFEVPEELGLDIHERLKDMLPGYGVARYVREIPGRKSKTELPDKL